MGKTYRRIRDDWDDRTRIKKSDMKKVKGKGNKSNTQKADPWYWMPNDKTTEDETYFTPKKD